MLKDTLPNYIHAGFAGIWIETFEPDEAQYEIADICKKNSWPILTWDADRGTEGKAIGDPLTAVKQMSDMAKADEKAILILHNYHRFLNNPIVIQAAFNQITTGKKTGVIAIVLAPSTQIPPELEKLFIILEHDLPNHEQLEAIAHELRPEGKKEAYPKRDAINAAAGLTHYEAENAFALSIVQHNDIKPSEVWEIKTNSLKKSGLLQLYRGKETFENLGGLHALKEFCQKALNREADNQQHSGPLARGILLLGVPGAGKSHFAKALGNQLGRPTLLLDPGSLMGSLVGETEQRTRNALKIADAMAPCILFIDEGEKLFAGATSEHQGDSGVSARQFGSFLTWLNDHNTPVFVIMTCNDISKLPPEFTRAERWDAVFFIDLPTEKERQAIWNIYTKAYHKSLNLGAETKEFANNWTGAEIKACCRLAALLDIPIHQAAANIIPIAQTTNKVTALREWASGKCLDATNGGIYRNTATQPPIKRKVTTNKPIPPDPNYS